MYSTILCFLLAVTIHVLAPRSTTAALGFWQLFQIAAVLGGTWLAVRARMRRMTLSALASERYAEYLRPRFTHIIQHYQALLLLPFAIFTYGTEYNPLVVVPLSKLADVLGGLTGLFPYILMWLILWWESYRLKGLLFGRGESRLSFVLSHARMEAAVVAPWFVLLALGDLGALVWPQASLYLEKHPLAQLFYAPLFLTVASVFMPLLVKRIWGCTPLPPGPLRDRLNESVAKMGLKVREILFWPLMEGRLLTAGIVGPMPRFRYLLITPALASVLDADELDGVVAHEAGHIKYGHLWHYLFFFSGILVGGLAIFFQLSSAVLIWWFAAYPDLAANHWAEPGISAALTLGMGGVLFVSFRVLFGKLSRSFERQADLFALEMLGRPGPIASALETISANSGDIRDLPSWHHGSVAERVAYVNLAASDPTVGRSHHRSVRRLKRAIIAVVTVLFALAAFMQLPDIEQGLKLKAAKHGFTLRVGKAPDDWVARRLLGDIELEGGREAEALDSYLEAIRLNPEEATALNNAAWIMLTAADPSLQNPVKALELARRAAGLMPVPHILDTLAEALYRNGDPEGALAAIGVAIKALPPFTPDRAQYLEKQRKYAEALKENR